MMDIHARCISIIAHLWGVQKGEKAIGQATTGSSEAIHLGGLAMKRRWQEKRMKVSPSIQHSFQASGSPNTAGGERYQQAQYHHGLKCTSRSREICALL